jgi:hypothetical protein
MYFFKSNYQREKTRKYEIIQRLIPRNEKTNNIYPKCARSSGNKTKEEKKNHMRKCSQGEEEKNEEFTQNKSRKMM